MPLAEKTILGLGLLLPGSSPVDAKLHAFSSTLLSSHELVLDLFLGRTGSWLTIFSTYNMLNILKIQNIECNQINNYFIFI